MMLTKNVRLVNEKVAGVFIMRGGLCAHKVNVDASYFYVLIFFMLQPLKLDPGLT